MKSHASMNRIYRLVFNAALGIWVAVAENAKGRGKAGRAACALLAVLVIISPSAHAADAANASVVVGTGSVATQGVTTTINQVSQRLAIDWTQLSTAANEALKFNQPNAQAIALNRITGSSPSSFLGSLTANGQVFILNPNGVLFGAGSQVNVGGLVASTLAMSNADFQAGRNIFTNSGGTGSVVNQGTMTAASGGYLALLAPEVRNEGVMTASLGTALLAAGNKVTLNLDNGSLLGYSIDQGAINALAENKHLIKADGGQVLLSAKAMDTLTTATVNNTGVIEARTIQNKAGRILLMGDMETGTVNVGGTLDASAPTGGNGGFIETSAAHVKVATGTRVTTQAAAGKTGKWLIDPNDFIIDSITNGGHMDAATVASTLATTDFEIQTAIMGTTGNGDINVNQALTWGSANTLTLTAQRDININQAITATSGGLTLNAVNQITAPADVNVGTFTLAGGAWSQLGTLPAFSATDFRITGGSFLRALGGDGSANSYLLSDVYGLQGIGAGGLLSRYILANNIDASGTANWNAGAGFKPIGNLSAVFGGEFYGNNNTISNLTINRPGESYVGLFGKAFGASLRNVGLINVSVNGFGFVGGLVGYSAGAGGYISKTYVTGSVYASAGEAGGLAGLSGGTLVESYSTGSVTGAGGGNIGGLVGVNVGDIYRSYSASTVQSTGVYGPYATMGGLVGYTATNSNQITYSYATGSVSGGLNVGGLVGWQYRTNIRYSYATGSVSGGRLGPDAVGALIGIAESGRVTSSFWLDGATRGVGWDIANRVDGLSRGLSSTEFTSTATYTNAGWRVSNVGGEVKDYRVYEGQTGPLLRNLLTPLTLADSAVTYNGDTQQGVSTTDPRVQGNSASGRNAGSYATGYYSDQQGVDIIGGGLTVNKANLVLMTSDVTKTYDGGLSALGTAVATANTALLGTDTASGGSFAFIDKNAGAGNKTVTASGVTVNDGNSGNNYNVSYLNNISSTITPKALTVSGITADNKVYDRTDSAAVNTGGASYGGLVNGDVLMVSATGVFTDKNVANGKTVNLTSSYSGADVNNYAITDQATALADITPKSLTVSGITADNKVYDQGRGATVNTGSASYSGLISGDLLAVNATGTFSDKNVANGKTVNLTSNYSGTDVGNYTITNQATTVADITPKSLTYTATAANKVYDGNTSAVATLSALTGLVGLETVTATSTGATFNSKDVLTANTVTVGSASLANGSNGGLASNYSIAGGGTAAASITPKALSYSTAAADKVYDGNTTASATVSGLTGMVGSETVTVASNTASFNTKNVMTANLVTVNSVSLGNGNNGGLASNYMAAPGGTTAIPRITPRPLTVTATPDDKVYDGTTAATVSYADNRVMGDRLTFTSTANFADKNVGNDIAVNVSTVTPGGMDASNYRIGTIAVSGTADITPKTLTVTANDATHQGGTAYRGGNGVVYSGFVAGEGTGVLTGAVAYSGDSQGAKTAGQYDIIPGGQGARNYSLDFVEGTLTVKASDVTTAALGGKTELKAGLEAVLTSVGNIVGSVGGGGSIAGSSPDSRAQQSLNDTAIGTVGGTGGGSTDDKNN